MELSLEEMRAWNESLIGLSEGRFDCWPHTNYIRSGQCDQNNVYEKTPTFNLPIWEGQNNQTVLINADFGLGDTIFFARYLKLIKNQYYLNCHPSLHELLGENVVFNDWPPVDSMIHMMSLPLVLGRTIHQDSYLQPVGPCNPIIDHVKNINFTKIGLCWESKSKYNQPESKNIPIDKINCLVDVWRLKPFALVQSTPPISMFDLRLFTGDMNHLAHLISAMDIVFTVDTSVAHLAGAIGVKTILLVTDPISWYWTSGVKWYENITIVKGKDWDDVLVQISSIDKFLN